MNDQNETQRPSKRTSMILGSSIVALIAGMVAIDNYQRREAKEAVAEYLSAHRTDSNNFIYDGKDLTKFPVYRFKAWKGFTPSHVVFGENVGSVPADIIKAANREGLHVIPDMDLYDVLNGKGHMPVNDVRVGNKGEIIDKSSDIYAIDLNGDGKIAGKPISQLEKTTWEACMQQKARRDVEYKRFVEQRSYQRSQNRR